MFAEVLFIAFAALSILGAMGLILFRHPMNGAMSLVITMISLAGLYALLSAKLIFVLQLIVYAGAIMSLMIFIIMFLNIQDKDLPKEEGRFWYLAGGIAVIIPIATFLIKVVKTVPETQATIVGNGFGGVKEVGQVIQNYLILSVILFCLGVLGVISRRNVFTVFMSIELMLNAANLAIIAFSRVHESMDGHVLAMMIMAVAAAEAALALAVVILLHKHKGKLDTNVFSLLKG